jgi:hypothetical protein
MPGVFYAEADQPSLKREQLPPFYAFSGGFRIMLTGVARTLHFQGSKPLWCRCFHCGEGWNPLRRQPYLPLLWITAAALGLDPMVLALSFP